MLIGLRAWWARKRMPRCEYCATLVHVPAKRLGEIVACDNPKCQEQFALERELGYS